MQKSTPFPHRAWVVALGCALVFAASSGLFFDCGGLFTAPVPEALGVGRGAFALHISICSYVGLLTLNFYGELFRRHPLRLRRFMLASALVCSGCTLGYSFATKLWHFYALATLFGLAYQPLMGLALTTLIGSWFAARRGFVTGLVFTGSSLAAAVMTPLTAQVMAYGGWRWGYRLLAGAGLALLVLGIALIRETPAQLGLTPLGAAPEAEVQTQALGMTRAQALRSPVFWLMTLGFFCVSASGNGLLAHAIATLTEQGLGAPAAASAMSVAMLVMMGAKPLLGLLFDRLGAVFCSLLTGGGLLLATLALMAAGNASWMPLVFAVCLGCGAAAMQVALPLLVGENFGQREYAALYSLAISVGGLGSLSGAVVGFLFDLFNSYAPVWPIFAAVAAVATVALTAAAAISRRRGYMEL